MCRLNCRGNVARIYSSAVLMKSFNHFIAPMLCMTVVLVAAQLHSEEATVDKAAQPRLKGIAFRGGSVYEVLSNSEFDRGTNLFRFHQGGKFDFMDAQWAFLEDSGQWIREDGAFKVTSAPHLHWSADGTFTENGIQGVVREEHCVRRFTGRRVRSEEHTSEL